MFAIVLFVLSIPSTVPAQETLEPGRAADVGMSAAVLRAGVSLYEDAIANDELRGAVLLVARKGKIVLHEAVGWRNKEDKRPMQKDTLFRMASNTKPAVAAAVLMLAERNKLRLDDNVREFLPAFDNYRSGFITVRHLLNHTSGLRIGGIFITPILQQSPEHPGAPSLQVEVARFGAVGAEALPGTTFRYNNPGFNTAGAIIEVVSKMPLEEFLDENIYKPLGMHDTSHRVNDDKVKRMSRVYRRRQGKWTIAYTPGDPPDWPFVRASGGMISTARDYAMFCQMYLNQGIYRSTRVLRPASVQLATSPTTRPLVPPEQRTSESRYYGLGWFVAPDGVFSHGGSDGTFAWVDPKREVIGLIFTQSPGGKNPRGQFQRIVNAACSDVQ